MPSGTGVTPRRRGSPGREPACARIRSRCRWPASERPGERDLSRHHRRPAGLRRTLREINEGTLLHYDDVRREFPCRLFDQETVAQLAFNVWAAVPHTGGATTLWRHRWDPADEQHRYSYGYRPKTVEHCQQVSLRPQLGGALLFNPAHFHEVQANPGQRRIALAFFLALTTTGQLITWS